MQLRRILNGALAGAAAAVVWAAQQPVDKRIAGSDYDDLELLGKLVTQGENWKPVGLLLHTANGAIFGAVYSQLRPLSGLPPLAAGVMAGMIENFGFWPLSRVLDERHPARFELEQLSGNSRAFALASWRHFLFGAVLGMVEWRLNRDDQYRTSWAVRHTTNGHGDIEEAVSEAAPEPGSNIE